MTALEGPFKDRYGLHPRSAMQIQRMANGFRSRLTITDVTAGGSPVDARSMLSLVSSGIRAGDTVRVTAEGEDEAAAAEALRDLMAQGVCHP